jgi:hypothetical protein
VCYTCKQAHTRTLSNTDAHARAHTLLHTHIHTYTHAHNTIQYTQVVMWGVKAACLRRVMPLAVQLACRRDLHVWWHLAATCCWVWRAWVCCRGHPRLERTVERAGWMVQGARAWRR